MSTTRFLALGATFAIAGSALAAFDGDWKERIETANSALAPFGVATWAEEAPREVDPPDPDRVGVTLSPRAGTDYDVTLFEVDPPDPDRPVTRAALSTIDGAIDLVLVAGDPPTEADPPDPDADPPTEKDVDPPNPDADPPDPDREVTVTIVSPEGRLLGAYALDSNGKLVEIALR